MYVLGIESTCDETAAAIVEDGRKVISNVISTSVKEQALYGGVVPEIASRRHAEYISATVDKAFADAGMTIADVDAVAVTFAPGLIGAVLVGVNFAKGLAYAAGKPLVPVHHLRGHIAANYLTHPDLKPPFLCLVASGGHSHIVQVEDWCHYHISAARWTMPRAKPLTRLPARWVCPTPAAPAWPRPPGPATPRRTSCPSPCGRQVQRELFRPENRRHQRGSQRRAEGRGSERGRHGRQLSGAHCQILAKKLLAAAADTNAKQVVLAGGVAANGRLRQLVNDGAQKLGAKIYLPELKYCGDNGAMIAAQGYYEFQDGNLADWSLNGLPTLPIDYR